MPDIFSDVTVLFDQFSIHRNWWDIQIGMRGKRKIGLARIDVDRHDTS